MGTEAWPAKILVCGEKDLLGTEVLATLKHLVNLQRQNTQTILDGDAQLPNYFERLRQARMAWDNAKTAYSLHTRSHGC